MHSRVMRVVAIVALLAVGTITVLLARTGSAKKIPDGILLQSPASTKPRNLSLQPEAFKMSRRLGSRFMPSRQSMSTMIGILITGTAQQDINVTRRQTSTGEEVGIAVGAGTLAWDDVDGAKALGSNLTEAQQTLIERLVLDNPDQFVLAQLRGASYYTVARNVRADTGGGDEYHGPVWDVIRVVEPQNEGARRLLTNSRLYYLNVETGLIDKIVSELKGETIEASILEWSDRSGDKFPFYIVWKHGNETIQEFRLTSVSIQPQQ